MDKITSGGFAFQPVTIEILDCNPSALFTAIYILLTLYIQRIFALIYVHFDEHLICTFLSIPITVLIHFLPEFGWFAPNVSPKDIIAILAPLRIFAGVFFVDIHILRQCWLSVLVLNTLGFYIFVLLIGTAMCCADKRDLNLSWILCYGVAMSSMDIRYMIRSMQTIDFSSTTRAILISETMISFANSMITLDIHLGVTDGFVKTFHQIVLIYIRMIALGLLIGCFTGKVMATVVNPRITQYEHLILLWLILAYMTYYLCEGVIYCSGSIAVFVYAIFISTEKNRVAVRAFQKMEFIMDSLHYILTTYGYYATFLNAVTFLPSFGYLNVYGVLYAVLAYGSSLFARAVVVMLMYPFMFRKTKNNANSILTMMFSRAGILELNQLRVLVHNPVWHKDMEDTYVTAVLMVMLQICMNNTIVKLFFKTFGTNVVNIARKNNIACCIDLLENTRLTYFHIFQMEKHYGDANWKLIYTATDLKKLKNWDKLMSNKQFYGFRPSCVECLGYSGVLMTTHEKAEKLKDLRVTILRTQRVSLNRQREQGLILKSDLKALFKSIDVTAITQSLHVDIPELSILHKKSALQNLKSLLVNIRDDFNNQALLELTNNKSTKYHSKLTQQIITTIFHPIYDLILYLVIIMNSTLFYSNLFTKCSEHFTHIIPYSAFTLDAILKFLFFSQKPFHKKLKYVWYNFWNKFDAVMLCINAVEVMLIMCRLNCERLNMYGYVVYLWVMFIGQLRLLRIVHLFYAMHKSIIKYCDKKTEARVYTGYSRAISVLFSYHEVLHILPNMVGNMEIRRMIEKEIVREKAILLAHINNVQYKFTPVAVTSKTKRIINTSIATMRETIAALKLMGFTDETENNELINRVEKLRKPISDMPLTNINSPSQILRWLPFFESMSDFDTLYAAAIEWEYEPGELILTKGLLSEGIYVIIEGLASMKKTLEKSIVDRIQYYGALPVKEYLCDVDYYHASVHYITSGNSIGILSYLTNRPCDYDVKAIVKTKVFFLNADVLELAMKQNSNPVYGLRSRLWKYVTVNLAMSIMWRVPTYRNLRMEETYYYMEKSFVPDTTDKRSVYISDDVEDLILVEGRIRDTVCKKVYIAPCYLPRSVRKIYLIRNPKMLIEPKLFVIPLKPELHSKIYANFEISRRPVFAFEETRSYHSVFNDSSIKKFNIAHRVSFLNSENNDSSPEFKDDEDQKVNDEEDEKEDELKVKKNSASGMKPLRRSNPFYDLTR